MSHEMGKVYDDDIESGTVFSDDEDTVESGTIFDYVNEEVNNAIQDEIESGMVHYDADDVESGTIDFGGDDVESGTVDFENPSATADRSFTHKALANITDLNPDHALYRMGEYYIPQGAQQLGKGGQAEVYPALSTNPSAQGQVFAAKVYVKVQKQQLREIVEIEEKLKQLDHENVVHNYATGMTDDGSCYMVVMEFCQPLQMDYLNYELHGQDKNFTANFLKMVKDLNEGMHAYRGVNIFHADIKPKNIMKRKDLLGNVNYKYIDFGGGKAVKEEESGKHASQLVVEGGFNHAITNQYLAPEFWALSHVNMSERGDVFSTGVSMARMLCGVVPRIQEISNKNDEKNKIGYRYYLKNESEDNEPIYGFLLPKGLSPAIKRYFRGVLYYNYNSAEMETKRWGTRQIDRWIELMEAGNYEAAATIDDDTYHPAGAVYTSAPHLSASASGVRSRSPLYVTFTDGSTAVQNEHELVDLFLDQKNNHWTQTMANVMSNPKWVDAFTGDWADIGAALSMAGDAMNETPQKAEEILTERIVRVFGSDEAKNQLIHNGLNFKDKETLGRWMGATIQTAINNGGFTNLQKLSQYRKQKVNDRLFSMLTLFETGFLSHYMKDHENWNVSDQDMDVIRRWERRVNSPDPNSGENKVDDVIDLLRLSYRLQNSVMVRINDKSYTQYSEIKADLQEQLKAGPQAAFAFQKRLLDGDKKFRPEVYAFMMEASDVVVKPGAEMKPIKLPGGSQRNTNVKKQARKNSQA